MDHVFGREKMGHSRNMLGTKLWYYLKTHNYPSGYQVLCWNCNSARTRLKICPHNKKKYQIALEKWIEEKDSRKRCVPGEMKVRDELFRRYSDGSPKCACCEIKGLDFLTLDHISGRNIKIPKELLKQGYTNRKKGLGLWRILRDARTYPKLFQILCWNCNSSKGLAYNQNICPHENST